MKLLKAAAMLAVCAAAAYVLPKILTNAMDQATDAAEDALANAKKQEALLEDVKKEEAALDEALAKSTKTANGENEEISAPEDSAENSRLEDEPVSDSETK